MIRGAVYRVDFGDAKRGHEQRGRRYAVVISPGSMPWSVVTVVPTSTSAQPAVFRPELEVMGTKTRFLVDQIRTIGIVYVHGDPVDYLDRDQMAKVEHAVARYLGLGWPSHLQMGHRPGPSVELPGIEPGSYGIPSRLLRAQFAMPLLGSPGHAN